MADRPVRPKVLLVDDDRDTRSMYRAYLTLSGCDVRTARDGQRAIDKAHQYVPDVIVMDLAMPNLDGWTASTWLKGSPVTKHIPIIALSAMANARESAHAAGVLRDALALAGIPESAWRPRVSSACDLMCAYVQTNRDQVSTTVLPGVTEVLRHLSSRKAILGIATGNPQAIGAIKLESCDLLHWFDFHAFSDGLEHRADVYSLALERARSLAGSQAAVCAIGDTPADIRAARHHGIAVIAVATGIHSLEQLSAEEPGLLLSSLRALVA